MKGGDGGTGDTGGRKKKKDVTDYCVVIDSVGERKHDLNISSAEKHQNNIANKKQYFVCIGKTVVSD